ncbi:MAG: glycosyltransferase [Armatimonadota bacterium]|nr:glycosyltransferase [Armatimonadota bacterium]
MPTGVAAALASGAVDRGKASSPERLAVVVLTTAYPIRSDGGVDAVLAKRTAALAALTDVCVVVPTPWAPRWLGRLVARWRRYSETPRRLDIMGVETFYPRYVQLPGRWFVPFAPLAIVLGILPRLWRLRRTGRLDILYGQATLPDGLASALAGNLLRVPAACLARGLDVNDLGRRTPMGRWLTRLTVRWSAGVATVAHDLMDGLSEIAPGRSRTEVIYDGIDLEAFRPGDPAAARARLGLEGNGRVVLFVGRLVEGKGLDTLLEAFARLRAIEGGARLVLVGDGALAPVLRRRVRNLGLGDAVRFAGERPYAEIPTWMQAADVLVLPSESEGFPNVIREALACGLPVVATPVGEIPRILTEAVGRLVPVGDAAALATALRDVLRKPIDRSRVRSLVRDATWERNARSTLAFLRAAAGCGERPA